MNTITTYEDKNYVWNTLQYGWEREIIAYRIKDYKMRFIGDMSSLSLIRVRKLLDRSRSQMSDTSENWFKTVHYIAQPITGVISQHSVEWLGDEVFYRDAINLGYEAYCEELDADPTLSEYEKESAKEDYEDGDVEWLIGSWKKVSGEYEPDETGEYAAIVNSSTFNTVQIVWSKYTTKVRAMCSPCFPGQADLDSGEGEILAYTLPKEIIGYHTPNLEK